MAQEMLGAGGAALDTINRTVHELATPLMPALLHMHLLGCEQGRLSDRGRRSLQALQRSLARVDEAVRMIGQMARLEAGLANPVPLWTSMESLWEQGVRSGAAHVVRRGQDSIVHADRLLTSLAFTSCAHAVLRQAGPAAYHLDLERRPPWGCARLGPSDRPMLVQAAGRDVPLPVMHLHRLLRLQGGDAEWMADGSGAWGIQVRLPLASQASSIRRPGVA